MDTFFLVPWPETEWSKNDRCGSRTPVPLTRYGADTAAAWGQSLARIGPLNVHTGTEQVSIDTAGILVAQAGGHVRSGHDLDEVDLGLWEGLTHTELQRRYPKVYKRWRADPSAVRPPDGEKFTDVQVRIRKALRRVFRKGNGQAGVAVLGPLAMIAARSVLSACQTSAVVGCSILPPLGYHTDPPEVSDEFGFLAVDAEEMLHRQCGAAELAQRT